MYNYPNMSHCMFNNTVLAMEQINSFMLEADAYDIADVSKEEIKSMRELIGYCEQFLELVEEFEEKHNEAANV